MSGKCRGKRRRVYQCPLHHPQRLRLLSPGHLLDRVVRIPFSVAPAGPAEPVPSPVVRQVEPFYGQPTFPQLRYSQLVILFFNNVLWPHVTVATMTLSDG